MFLEIDMLRERVFNLAVNLFFLPRDVWGSVMFEYVYVYWMSI